MSLRRHLIVIVVLGAVALAREGRAAAPGPEPQPTPPKPAFQTIVAPTAREIGQVFTTSRPGWSVTDAGYGGSADGNWSYALAGHESWQDYRVVATVTLRKPADRQDGMELGSFAVFNNLANLGGYEAGVIAHYQGPQRFYRVAVSALWKELILWRPSGGVLQVAPYPFEAGKSYTLAVECQGPHLRVTDNKFEFHTTGITGTVDWTPFSYVTSFPTESWGVNLYWRNSGPGTVWFDDFRIEPLEDKAVVSPSRDYPIKPTDVDLVLNWNGQGDARNVLDTSGHGSHGKFHGGASWSEVDGHRVLTLDGRTGYIWPLSSPNLTLGPDTTMVFDLKPEAGGFLIQWGFAFNYSVTGSAPKFQVHYYAAGKNYVSQPILDANVWQRLVIVATPGKIALYVNGRRAEELAANTLPGNPSNHLRSTWHRHLSFFGAGSADYGLVPEGPYGCLKGQVRAVKVYKRALTAEEIAKL